MCHEAQAIISRIEGDPVLPDHRRAECFKQAHDLFEQSGDTLRAAECRYGYLAFSFVAPQRTDPRTTDQPRFEPAIHWTDGRSFPPPLDALTEDVWHQFAEAAMSTGNPAMRARYADLRWEGLRTHADARTAIQAYRELAQVLLPIELGAPGADAGAALADALARAMELALQINEDALARQCACEAACAAEQLVDGGAPRWAYDILSALVTNRALRGAVSLARLEDAAARAVRLHQSRADPVGEMARLWLRLRRRIALIRDDREGARQAQLEIAGSLERQGDREAAAPARKLAAADWYAQAGKAYRGAGDASGHVDRVQRKREEALNAAGAEFRPYCTTIRIPEGEVETCLKRAAELLDEHGLIALGDVALPCAASARAAADQSLPPLLAALPEEVVRDARTVARAVTPDEKKRSWAMRLFAQHFSFLIKAIVGPLLDERRAQGKLCLDDFRHALRDAGLLQPHRRELATAAFDRYLAEDWLSAIHIWTFQIEAAVRRLALLLGRPITYSDPEGLDQARPLGDLLSDEEVARALGDDLCVLSRCVLCDRAAMNIRNQVAHGLVGPRFFNRANADALLVVLMAMAGFRATCAEGKDPAAESGAPQ